MLIMREIDALPRAWRALVHEFGFVIVKDMIDFGYDDAAMCRTELVEWRSRRQAEWLATQYVRPRDLRFGEQHV